MYVNGNENFVFAALAAMEALGALVAHPAVGKVQGLLNAFARDSSGTRAGYAALTRDDKYGGCTHEALKRFCAWYATQSGGRLAYAGDAAVDRIGPMAVANFLLAGAIPPLTGLTSAELAEAQQAFVEWTEAGRPSCGTALTIKEEPGLAPSEGPGSPTTETILPPQARRKLGTFGWFVIGVVVVAGAATVYHFATREPPAPPPASRTRGRAMQRSYRY